jgi:hypothetical protein
MKRTLTSNLHVFAACWLASCAADTSNPQGGRMTSRGAAGGGSSDTPVIEPQQPVMNMTRTVVPTTSDSGLPPSATGGAGSQGQCGAVTQTAQNTLQPVDIIISIDTSGTMRDEAMFVKENMNAFSQQIKDAGIDVHVVLISSEWTGQDDGFGGLLFTDGLCIAAPLGSGECPNDTNLPGYAHIVEVIGQWNILDAYITLYPKYKAHLRERSLKTFVSVSDADATTGAEKFMNDVMTLDPSSTTWASWRYAAIYPFTDCGDGQEGFAHADLVERTMGIGGDMCQQDFAPVFDEIAKKLVDVAQLSCDWAIPAPPSMETFDPAMTNVALAVNGQSQNLFKSPTAAECADREGWHYDDEANPTRVVACPATCARIQAAASAEVTVLFGCETQINPS